MRKRIVIDGTPDEAKVSCPVWRGGKSGDNFKGLPITIEYHLRWFRSQLTNRRSVVQSSGRTHRYVRLRQPGKR